ncbi:phosphoserine phosphatase SerB [Helicobacter sp. MIT 00-7814]|uniref:phosphoserine phosphatase SerB n=1 Tax=unclassified Helicobacter TaxID=2593540 RepID=UPI000E1E9830|nr:MULTISPECIES: phosphoserine phosphatase SerB [unclassified Helicobacter]RDU51670.1 phosphoserine phosphatase SerB [Helicobacter sp. MIT 00-7814]RDU52383.1 phosphoserine phosphatase SerB [Helicobacter sp. MIT 99-10781]
MKLAVFDFDSTLMNGETIDFLANECGAQAQVAHITAQAMEGKLDYYESLKSRVALLKGLSLARAKEICENLPLNLGAREIVQILKSKGYKVVCFSGGFSLATRHFAKILELDSDFSNILHVKDGVLSGEIGGEMMFSTSKGEMLVRLQNLLGIDRQNTLCVGDGANDLSMFAHADTRIAFCAKNVLKEAANIIIDKQDLREIEKYV